MFAANYDAMGSGYHIVDCDSDGIGKVCIRVYSTGFAADIATAEQAARFLVLALNMDGGLDKAMQIIRAESVRQKA